MTYVLTIVALITTSSFVSSYDIRCFRPNHDHDVVTLIHPEDCRKFYKCDQSFNAVEQSCPPLLEFDPVLKICDWPKGYCTADSKPVDSVMNCNGLPENTYQADYENDCRSFFYCKNGVTRIGRCIPETRFDIMSQMCIDENLVDCYLPTDISKRGSNFLNIPLQSKTIYDDPIPQKFPNYGKSCQTYFICQNGRCREENCYFGKIFDSITKQCVTDAYCHESYTIGSLKGRISPSYIDCSVKQGRWYPDEEDCTRFYICANGTAYKQQCLVRQYFDRKRGICLEGSTETCQPDPGPECKCSCGSYKEGDKLPDLFYSTKYYVCQSGVLKSMTCIGGADFDEETLKCVGEDVETTTGTSPSTPSSKTCGLLSVGDTIPDEFGTGSYYYICTEGGILKRVQCEDDHVYQNGECSPPIITPPPTGNSCGPLLNGDSLPDDFDDTMFYVCVKGILNHKSCQPGQIFDKLLLICKTGTGTTLPSTTPPSTTTAVPEKSCGSVPPGGLIADPFDNTKYYKCVDGTMQHQSCPVNHYFDSSILQCVSTVPTTTPVIKNCGPTPDGGFAPDPLDNTRYFVCVQGVLELKNCPEYYTFDPTKLQCTTDRSTTVQPCKNCGSTPEGGFVPNPDDESKFYVCVNGALLPRSCPEGEQFDPKIMQCTNGLPTTTPEIRNCGPTPDGTFLPDFFDKKKFYVCVAGVLKHLSCQEDAEFDARKLQCVSILLTTTSSSTTTVSGKNCGSVPNGAFIPDEFDNTKFYVCVSGVLEHKNCPDNTYFDKVNLVCTSTEPSTTVETKSCGSIPVGGFIPDEFDESKFYVCVDGDLRHFSCPAGQIFDKSQLICTSSQIAPTTTTLAPESGDCGPTPNGGFLPDEFDNRKFYVCVNGALRHLSCPVDTIFDKDKLRCEESSATTTTQSTTTESTTPSTSSTTTTTTTSPPPTTTSSTTTTTSTTTTQPGCGTDNGLIPYGDVLPDKFDETAFYICLPPGVLKRINCPENTIFSAELKRCEAPTVTVPPSVTTTTTTTPFTTPTTPTTAPSGSCGSVPDGGRLPDKFDTAKFYVCVQGVLWHMTCPVDQIFDETSLMCVAASTTTPTIPIRSCGSLADGSFIPDKFNNAWFYVCYNGALLHRQCPAGQLFDPQLLICKVSSSPSTTPEMTTTTPSTTTPSTTTPSTTTTSTTTTTTSTTTSSPNEFYDLDHRKNTPSTAVPASGSCGPTPDGSRIPDAFSFSWFYLCSNGVLRHRQCPFGGYFDPELNICNVTSTSTTTPTTTTTTTISTTSPVMITSTSTETSVIGCGPLKEGEMLPDEFYINKYYVCVNRVLNQHTCPTGLIFDKINLYCYNCTIESSSTTTEEPSGNCGSLSIGDMIPDDFDKHKFYICIDGYLKNIECIDDLIFDPQTSTCISEESPTTTSTTTASTTTTAGGSTPARGCGDLKPDGIIPDELDRHMFYKCVDGYLKHIACPGGLVFDPSTMSCKLEEPTTPTTQSTSTTSTTSTTTTTTSTPTTTTTTIPTTTTSSTTGRPNAFCPGGIPPGTALPNELNCLAFVICENGQLIDKMCEEGFYFNRFELRCLVNTGQCAPPVVTPAPGCGIIANGEFMPNFFDNTKFFVCDHGQLIPETCGNNQIFDPVTLICISRQTTMSAAITVSTTTTQSTQQNCGVLKSGEFIPDFGSSKYFFVCVSGLLERRACPATQIFDKAELMCVSVAVVAPIPAVVAPMSEYMDCGVVKNGEFLPNIHDEAKYYICLNGMLTPQACEKGQIFKADSGICLRENLMITKEPGQIAQIPGKRACKDMQPGAHVRHETDSTKYYVCVLNMLQEGQCPPGHIFDSNELYCRFVWKDMRRTLLLGEPTNSWISAEPTIIV